MSKDLDEYIVSPEDTIAEAMKKINRNTKGVVALCIDRKLVGIVTEGDVRRAIIHGKPIDDCVKTIATSTPIYLQEKDASKADDLMKEKGITAIPIIDDNGMVIDIKFILYDKVYPQLNIPVVIMAGGKGSRLKPYTDILPKPLIPIAGKAITEHIMERFMKYGCSSFDIIVNYRKGLIKAFFEEQNYQDRKITFVNEEIFLGTAGGLKLLQGKINETFFLTNCDILVEADYSQILDYHKKNHCLITIVCANKKMEIPYGTVEVSSNGHVKKFREKPSIHFYTSTGMYILEPCVLENIPSNKFIHITDIIKQYVKKDISSVGAYIVDEENWLDMGQFDEYEKMKKKLDQNG